MSRLSVQFGFGTANWGEGADLHYLNETVFRAGQLLDDNSCYAAAIEVE